MPETPITGLLLSGGVDSAVLLAVLLERGWQVVPFYVETGCVWQREELLAVERFLAHLKQPRLVKLVRLAMPLADVYGPHWSMSGIDVPDDRTPDEAVFLPGRNPLLLIKPALWCRMNGVVHLALATLSGNPFRDARPEFFEHFEAMMHEAVGGQVEIARPFERVIKKRVLELGRSLPLELTFSCLSPIGGQHCGRCNKCAERHRGFCDIGLEDRTPYAQLPVAEESSLVTRTAK